MIEGSACAVIITFQPARDIFDNFVKIRAQVSGLVVVDNGSAEDAVDWLCAASREMGFVLIQNGDNLGIATALNIGIRWAESCGYRYTFLFDQDSAVTEGFIDAMLRFYGGHPKQDKIAILVPRYIDKRSGRALPARYAHDGGLQIAMCSGSLIPVSIFRRYGMFEDDFFIDYVDYEYCLRVRSADQLIEECKDAILMHAPGNPRTYHFGWIPFITSANYSAIRRYYLGRNMIATIRKYWEKYPVLCGMMLLNNTKDLVKIILVEEDKWEKAYLSFIGIFDGLRGRMGRSSRF